jgi:hypothetical protein
VSTQGGISHPRVDAPTSTALASLCTREECGARAGGARHTAHGARRTAHVLWRCLAAVAGRPGDLARAPPGDFGAMGAIGGHYVTDLDPIRTETRGKQVSDYRSDFRPLSDCRPLV